MADLRTTVILKTDIVDSTPRTAGQSQSEMGLQRRQHKQFISDIAVKNHGSIFQEENEFNFKGFPEPEKVYRVDNTHRTRILTDQYIVYDEHGAFEFTTENNP